MSYVKRVKQFDYMTCWYRRIAMVEIKRYTHLGSRETRDVDVDWFRPHLGADVRESVRPRRGVIRVGNCSGYYGDRHGAPHELLAAGAIDVLTGDYLAEVTMYLLAQARARGGPGYARLFLSQFEEIIGLAMEQGTRIVVNAGGLEPGRLAADMGVVVDRLGLSPRIAYIEGDDLLHRLPELSAARVPLLHLDDPERSFFDLEAEALTANAYLGADGIVDALARDADVVVCPRVTDASLVVGPAAWWHEWTAADLDALAGAVVAGHLIECGTQVTGGNYSFFREVPDLAHPGFPIAEIASDGSSTITKHPATGGSVSVGTVTEQLLYEVGSPRYHNPDVVARFDTVTLTQQEEDRVTVSGAVGEPPGPLLKVSMHVHGGHHNDATFLLTGLDVEEKARLLLIALADRLGPEATGGMTLHADLVRTDHPDGASQLATTAQLRIHARSEDPAMVGEQFARAVNSLPLATYPGCHWVAPPGRARRYVRFWPALIDRSMVTQRVVVGDEATTLTSSAVEVSDPRTPDDVAPPDPLADDGWTTRVPLGTLFGARSGDKGGDANVAVWAKTDRAYRWLWHNLTVDHLRQLLPDVGAREIVRHNFPRVRAVNFVVLGLLEDGALGSNRVDVQAKALGEYLRARPVTLPVSLLTERPDGEVHP